MPWATLLRVAAAVAVFLALVAARLTYLGASGWSQGEARLRAGDQAGAVAAFGRAARAQLPGDPWSARARARLAALAFAAEARGDRRLAVDAWLELRAAAAATRSLYQPDAATLRLADCRLARLTGRATGLCDGKVAAGAGQASVPWSLAALAGLVLWLLCALGWGLRAVDREDRLRPRPAILWAAGIVAGVALFFLGLLRA